MCLSARRVRGRDVDLPPLLDRRQQDVRDRSEPRARARRAQTPRYVHAHFNRRHHRVIAPSCSLARRPRARTAREGCRALSRPSRGRAPVASRARRDGRVRRDETHARYFYHRSRATHLANALLDDRLTAGIHCSPPSRSRAGEDLDAGPDGAALRRDPRPQRQASGRNHG